MIHVQIDVADSAEPGNETAVWSGWWEAIPAIGHTIQLRLGTDGHTGRTEFLRLTGIDWIVYAEEADQLRRHDRRVHGCIVSTERYRS